MKIALIKTRKVDRLNQEVAPPLGIMYIASFLREQKSTFKISLFDTSVQQNEYILENVKNADIVGISATNMDFHPASEIIRVIKKENKEAKIIIGGPLATSMMEDIFRVIPQVDFSVPYEGEVSAFELFEYLEKGDRPLENVKGIIFKSNGKVKFTGRREPIKDLDNLPFPAWDLIEPFMEEYWKRKSMGVFRLRKKYMPLFTSRGCPYRCIYCHDIFTKSFRAHSPERVVMEIEYLIKKYGIRDFEFFDDIFNFDLNRLIKICDLIIEKNLDIALYFPNGLRCDRLTKEAIDKLQKAGTKLICFAFETASERLQRLIKRNLRFDRINSILDYASQKGIYCYGFFMLGLPTETLEEMKKTIKFAVNSSLHSAAFFITIPQKGTELFSLIKNEINNTSADNIMMKSLGSSYFDYSNSISAVSPEKLKLIRKYAYFRFYLKPKRWWNIIKVMGLKRVLSKMFLQNIKKWVYILIS